MSAIDRSRLTSDVLAGITLAALGIPEVMGYTKIIGTPVITGLYTMLFPMLAFAVLGSSRHLVVAADSATAAIVAATLAGLAVAGSADYVAWTGLVALVAGGMLLAARLMGLGFLAGFLSRTVLVGFLTGVGLQIALGEVHGMLGFERPSGDFLSNLVETLRHLPQAHVPTLIVALTAVVVCVGFEHWAPRFPGALVAVVGAIVASSYFGFSQVGIKVVGAVPAGLPHLGLPANLSLSHIVQVVGVAFSCCVVILTQSAATARAYAFRGGEKLNEDRDLVGLSAANFAAALSGTFVVNGSPTKTEIVAQMGGRSQWAHVSASVVVALVLVFLTRPLSVLPSAVLSAIVFLIGLRLVDWNGLRSIFKYSRIECALSLLTAATVVIAGVTEGIILALVLSLLDHVRRSYRPATSVLVHQAGGSWLEQPVSSGQQAVPGLLVYRFSADLFYANVEHFSSEIEALIGVEPASVKWLVIDAGAITGIDYSAGQEILEVRRNLTGRSIRLIWVHANPSLLDNLNRMGLLYAGENFETLRDCLKAYAGKSVT